MLSEHDRRASTSDLSAGKAGARFRGNLLREDRSRDIGRVLGGKKLENRRGVHQRATLIPLQLQQSAIVRVGDLADVNWATRRPNTRGVAREAQTRAKILLQYGWSAASHDLSI
jgi:hypothetical protein